MNVVLIPLVLIIGLAVGSECARKHGNIPQTVRGLLNRGKNQ